MPIQVGIQVPNGSAPNGQQTAGQPPQQLQGAPQALLHTVLTQPG